MLLSFERPFAQSGQRLYADLENCTIMPTKRSSQEECERVSPITLSSFPCRQRDHRQDRKGTRWMPWHQESMKDVNGCDKPR